MVTVPNQSLMLVILNSHDLDLEFLKEDNLNSSSLESNKDDQSLFTEADSAIDLLTK